MKQIRLENSPIVYDIAGERHNECVLFLHAAFVSHEMFREQAEHFADRYLVLLPDIIGHGRSTDTRKGDSIEKMASWLYAILRKEGIEKAHVVGISLGAVLAQDFAYHYPESVSSLACFGGYNIHHFDAKLQKGNAAAQMLMMLKAVFSIKWFAKANKKISAYTPQAQNDFYEMNLRFPKKSFQYLATLNHLVNRNPAKSRTYPLLIGCGEYDAPMALEAVAMWEKDEPDCKKVIFDNAGHCVNMDAPEAFHQTLQTFWQACEQTAHEKC